MIGKTGNKLSRIPACRQAGLSERNFLSGGIEPIRRLRRRRLGILGAGGGWGLLLRRSGCLRGALGLIATTAKELEPLDEYTVLAPSHAVLAFPCVQLQAPFHQDGATLGHVLIERLSLLSIAAAVDETGLLALLAVLSAPAPVDRQTELHDRCLAGEVTHLRIACEISDQYYLIVVRHRLLPVYRAAHWSGMDGGVGTALELLTE